MTTWWLSSELLLIAESMLSKCAIAICMHQMSCCHLCFVVYLLVLWQHRAAEFAWYSLDCLLAEYDTEPADVLSNMHEVIHGHGSILAAPRC